MADIHLDLLDHVRVASPCSMRWDDMRGTDKVRHCDDCNLKVHNLSAMSREEAQAFVLAISPGERICGAFYRRADGTILTRDCPRGWAAVKQRSRLVAARIAATIAVAASGAVLWARGQDNPWNRASLSDLQPFAAVLTRLGVPTRSSQIMIMGDLCVPPSLPVNTAPAPSSATPPGGPS